MTPEESAAVLITHHPFTFAPSYRLPAFLVGVTNNNATVSVGPDDLVVRFGPWRLRTPIGNIAGTQRVSGFRWWRTAGPPRLSLVDRGVTFATNGDAAACVTFAEPVSGIDPTGAIKHPGATLTVADPWRLIESIETIRRIRAARDPDPIPER